MGWGIECFLRHNKRVVVHPPWRYNAWVSESIKCNCTWQRMEDGRFRNWWVFLVCLLVKVKVGENIWEIILCTFLCSMKVGGWLFWGCWDGRRVERLDIMCQQIKWTLKRTCSALVWCSWSWMHSQGRFPKIVSVSTASRRKENFLRKWLILD